MEKSKREPTVEFAIGAMTGCNLAAARQLAVKLLADEKAAVLEAYKGGKGRQVLTKIKSRIAMAEKAAKEKADQAKPPAPTDK